MNKLKTTVSVLAAAAAGAAFTGQAMAYEADAFLARLKAVLAEQALTLTWEEYEDTGSGIILDNVSASYMDETVPIGTIRMDDITDIDSGYRIGTITMPEYSMQDGADSFEMSSVTVTGMVVPAEGSDGPIGAGTMFYEGLDLENARVSIAGTEVFSMNNLTLAVTAPEGENPLTFDGGIESFNADLSTVEDPKAKQTIEAMGYTNVTGSFAVDGTWQPSDGRLVLSDYSITVEDAGTLGIALDLAGFTPEFNQALREMQIKMAENPDADQSAQGLAMLGLMQQLSFHSAVISFEDNSLTEKVLALVAEQQGVKPSDIANQAKAIVPFAMAQLNNPELASAASAAVTAFLDNPQNLRISAMPAAPVPFALIMAGAMSQPTELTKTLAVTVTANE